MRDDATKKGKQVEDKEKETEAKTADAEAEKTCESSQSDKADKDETAKEEPAGTAEQDEEPHKSEKPKENSEEEALNARYLRLMADFQNFKRRTEKEKSDIYAFANEKLVKELLDVIDNFERALAVGNDGDKFLEGMEMILKQLQGVLEKAGVAEIKCLGEDFDPNFHNAVMTEDSTEYESGKVTAVLQKGYTLNGRVVRPVMVRVSN